MVDPLITEIQTALKHETSRVHLTWVFNLTKGGVDHGCQVYLGRRRVGPILFPAEGVESTPANALRALADLLEVSP